MYHINHPKADIEKVKATFLNHDFKYLKIELEAQVDGIEDEQLVCTCGGEDYDDNGDLVCCDGEYEQDDEKYFGNFETNLLARMPKVLAEHNKYFKLYNDGSVNTELTMTFRVDYIHELPGLIKAFADTCRQFGDMITENAGLHITLLEGYKYPRHEKLPFEKLENYKKEMNKLMYALAFLASENVATRSFHFRDLEVHDQEKYSAIYTHDRTCLEFRIFDTCYNKPEMILNYLKVMARSLKYYTTDPTKVNLLKTPLSIDQQNKMLGKHYEGYYEYLKNIFKTMVSRKRLYKELTFLCEKPMAEILENVQFSDGLLQSNSFLEMIKKNAYLL